MDHGDEECNGGAKNGGGKWRTLSGKVSGDGGAGVGGRGGKAMRERACAGGCEAARSGGGKLARTCEEAARGEVEEGAAQRS